MAGAEVPTMPKRVLVLNGPNLNMLGIREPKTYGSQTLADIEAMCKAEGKKLGLTVECRQTNREGEICEWIQEAYGKKDGIVINPARLFAHLGRHPRRHQRRRRADHRSAPQQYPRPRGIPPSFLCFCGGGRGHLRLRRGRV